MLRNEIKLVVSDLDGTLIRYGTNVIPPQTAAVVRRLKEVGICFTIATGRSWRQTRALVRELAVDLPVILQAGSIVMDPRSEQVIRMQPLRSEIETQVSAITESMDGIDWFGLDEGGRYHTTRVSTGGGRWIAEASGEECRVGDWRGLNTSSVKHLFIGAEAPVRDIMARITATVAPAPNLVLWPPDQASRDWFLEVFDPAASKGQALAWLLRELELHPEQLMAIGDGHNDYDMVEFAGCGVATENAPADLQAKARLIIPDPEREGVAQLLTNIFFSADE